MSAPRPEAESRPKARVQRLSVYQHDRDAAGLRYVYPVVSRRAGGVSIGVNLNPNNACNFRCIYCQVPELSFGKAPPIDLELLELELASMFDQVLRGDFMERRVPEGNRVLKDLAISGNGEPTSCEQFAEVVAVLERVLEREGLAMRLPLVLITNGTGIGKVSVDLGLQRLAHLGGQVWFKLDSATVEGTQRINSNGGCLAMRHARLRQAAKLCPTWLQTCVFALDGEPPSEAEQDAYVELLSELQAAGTSLSGVLLYGLARPSQQPEASRLSALPMTWLDAFGGRLRAMGLRVKISG